MDDEPRDRWYAGVPVGRRRGPPGRRWQTGEGDRYLGAFLLDPTGRWLKARAQNFKTRAANAAENGRAMMARTRRTPAPPGIAAPPSGEVPAPITPSPVMPIAEAPQPEVIEAPAALARIDPPPAPSLTPARAPVTEAALASIIAVKRPIQPEMPPGGLVGIIPTFVIAVLVVMLAIAAVSVAGRMLFGPFWSLSGGGAFSVPSPPNPYQFPGVPQRR